MKQQSARASPSHKFPTDLLMKPRSSLKYQVSKYESIGSPSRITQKSFDQQEMIKPIKLPRQLSLPSWSQKGLSHPQQKRYTNPCNIKQIEDWIQLQLKSEGQTKSPMLMYEIDRLSLSKVGLTPIETDRLYRSLYVTTFSFFQQLQEIISNAL
jgi:hypothetical protein